MHRLLNSQCLSKVNIERNPHKCWLLFPADNLERKLTNNSLTVRFQSTTPNADLLRKIIRKRWFQRKKFTEVLEVTGGSNPAIQTNQTSVKNLRSNKLSEFIKSTNITADKPNQSKQLSATSDRLHLKSIEWTDRKELDREPPAIIVVNDPFLFNQNIERIQEITDSYNVFRGLNVDPEIIEDQPIPEPPDIEIKVPETIKKKPKVKKGTVDKSSVEQAEIAELKELKEKSRDRIILQSLRSYIELCNANGMNNRGLNSFLYYRAQFKKRKVGSNCLGVDVYNLILKGFSQKGLYGKVKNIYELMSDDKITPNGQTFGTIFECLSRMKGEPNEIDILIRRYYDDAVKYGISLNDVMDKSEFINCQREIVLNIIRKINPDFNPVYTPPVLTYSNGLLNCLNDNVGSLPGAAQIDNSIRNYPFTKQQLKDMIREQLHLETESLMDVKNITQIGTTPTETVLHYRKKLTELQKLWRSQICAAFNRDLNSLRMHSNSVAYSDTNLHPYLKCLDVGEYADILLREIRILAEASETYSPTVRQLHRDIGRKVENKYQLLDKLNNKIIDKTMDIHDKFTDRYYHSNTTDNPRQCWQRIEYEERSSGPCMVGRHHPWPANIKSDVGKFLYNILMRDLKIDTNAGRSDSKSINLTPAFYTLFRNESKMMKEEIKPHPVLVKIYRGSNPETLTFDSNMVPMLCPPTPWHNLHMGGYLIANSELIRLPQQSKQQLDWIQELPPEQIYPALDSLNQLASVPWKVNQPVLDIAIKVFNDGGSEKLDVPRPPSSLPPIDETVFGPKQSHTNADKFKLYRLKLSHRRQQSEMYGLWCEALYKLSLANHFRDKVFWLPHNMDFRGRVYPIPPHLNHLGADMGRSLLVFNDKKPLGIDGFTWLKLHCINLTGFKKRDSVRERILYAEEVMDDIIDSADNPLTGRKWWMGSDEPWQTLACCIEIANVTRSPDPTTYESSFPIHQDGSCNGLQHYAALGRDEAGAYSVNLKNTTVPQDVYSTVASLVEQARIKDADDGNQIAKVLSGYVRRKVIKQTVMTTVYGVTRFGARLQIAKQLKDIDNFPKEHIFPASAYLGAKTFDSIREMFTSTREIQDWFTDCARTISGTCGRNVSWITPLGLPVVQPYVRLIKGKGSDIGPIYDDDYPPNMVKQKNGFPPNFIHSLDSSHMMLTSLHCERVGITFISVHDCYWTHACTVPDMNKICRQQFVALHSEPILENLSTFLIEKYGCNERKTFSQHDKPKKYFSNSIKTFRSLPKTGHFDLRHVLDSVYFFS